jgi:hypothetical protein
MSPAAGWAWAGSVQAFCDSTDESLLEGLQAFHGELLSMGAAGSQVDAWRDELRVLRRAFEACVQEDAASLEWSVVLEYALPLEGGRRPDAVVLAGGSVVAMEFKSAAVPNAAFIDQAEGYARDLAEYHQASHGHPVVPLLVLAGTTHTSIEGDTVAIAGSDEVAHYLLESVSEGHIELDEWVGSPYAPLPTLVAAARKIFQHEPLPHVHRALSVGIPQTLELIGQLLTSAERARRRLLVLVAGVPGSGKTLVGLRLVYERSETQGRGLFLSGNGPLVQVLQHALQSRVFVRDLHAFIRTYGIEDRVPGERVLVFDEAQRAWDRRYMLLRRGVEASEPELLIRAGERIPEWSALVGLVGDGQEIHSGEEGGIRQWYDAVKASTERDLWDVHCPPRLAEAFEGFPITRHEALDLTYSLRSRRAEELHEWVSLLLHGSLPMAARFAARIQNETFPMYLTRDLDLAKGYLRTRYAEEPDKRYGLMVSSHAKEPRKYGFDNHFMAIQRLKVGPWFNADRDDPLSCCALRDAVTEFQCQGLELDLPLVCWGEDFLWTGSTWALKPVRRRYQQEDPQQLLTNAYRVLLTRGRDGLVVFLPPVGAFDLTEVALLAAGFKPLPDSAEMSDLARADVVSDQEAQ